MPLVDGRHTNARYPIFPNLSARLKKRSGFKRGFCTAKSRQKAEIELGLDLTVLFRRGDSGQNGIYYTF